MTFNLRRRLAAEGSGTAFLVATVVGSGIMADQLTDDSALALLCNSIATGAVLIVLVTILGPISGGHFNPAVSLVFAIRRMITMGDLAGYVAAQIAGGLFGAVVAHLMFGLPVIDASLTVRTGPPQWFAEAVATFGLITVIIAGLRFDRQALPMTVGLYITAAYCSHRPHRLRIPPSPSRDLSRTLFPAFARSTHLCSSSRNLPVRLLRRGSLNG